MRRAALLALLVCGCFSAQPPEGRYFCENSIQCLPGYTCYETYCCKVDRATGLCVDHPCLVKGTDADKDGVPLCANDCNDDDATVYPAAAELCDQKDNDCDGQVDEGLGSTKYRDADGDGHGDPKAPVVVCAATPNLVDNKDDCDDANPKVYGGAADDKDHCDNLDNDCDGIVDNAAAQWYLDTDGDAYGDPKQAPVTSCVQPTGYALASGDCDDTTPARHPNATEVCNDVDDNCDGQVDEGNLRRPIWPDKDVDGFGMNDAGAGWPQQRCAPSAGEAANNLDCNDSRNDVNPAVGEACDNVDNNCDGFIDEGVRPLWYRDADGDGHGSKFLAGAPACTQPAGGFVANNDDCNDADPAMYPGRAEVCDTRDNDCDGVTDEGLTTTYFADNDCDGYGNALAPQVRCPYDAGLPACVPSAASPAGNPLDCDDGDNTKWAGAPELCDAKDNNCDGVKDNAAVCGPRPDQTESAANWGAAWTAPPLVGATACYAGQSGTTAMPIAPDPAKLGDGGVALTVTDPSTRDFFVYFPAQRSAGWQLTGQRLRFDVAGGAAVTWDVTYRPVVVFFCANNGSWARFDPALPALTSAFATVVAPPVAPGGSAWTVSPGSPAFTWSKVDWIEVHANNGNGGTAQLWVDDFRIVPQ